MPEVTLTGCTPEPLMNYLKGLGVLRLVSEQADPEVRACWRNDVFVLRSKLDRDALTDFFINKYQPMPIVGPWAGGSGFFGKDNRKAVDALANATVVRCQPYREVIALVRRLLDESKIKDKPADEQKTRLLRQYRAQLPETVVRWMDAALILQSDGQVFAPLLGTGGNDGRLDFSQNFMMRLLQLGLYQTAVAPQASPWLDNSLFAAAVEGLPKAAVGQFAPGRAGGPNATQGMEGDATDNPWDFVLMIEGALILGGAAVRRFAANADSRAAFPFTVRPTAVGYASEGAGELAGARGELWLPVWTRPARLAELRQLFGEGRAEVAGRPARDGVDFARAAASLGVDRGIGQFVRLSFLKRSGKAYLAIPIGRFAVRQQRSVDLLRELDPWLDRFRRASADNNSPSRFPAALQGIEQAIFDFCRYGGPTFFQPILRALGRAERQLANGERFRTEKRLSPISGLSPDWILAANDDTPEFEIALALAGIFDPQRKIGSLRSNLEPVVAWSGKDGHLVAKWAEKDRAVAWNSASLPSNLAHVLARRMMDGNKEGCRHLPLAADNSVSLGTVSRFLASELDEHRIEELLWGLMLVEQKPRLIVSQPTNTDAPALPRAYALLKLLFLAEPLQINGEPLRIEPEAEIVALLGGGHIGQACRIAMRRLRASGLAPLPHPRSGGVVRDADWQELDRLKTDGQRLAAALLLPVGGTTIGTLHGLVVRNTKTDAQTQ